MSSRKLVITAVAIALVGSVTFTFTPDAAAVSLTDQTAADRAALAAALERYDAAQAATAETDARIDEVSAELDAAVTEEQACLEHLRTQVLAMYHSDIGASLALLLTASNVQDLAARLGLLERQAQQDADNLRRLKAARTAARQAADQLLALQAEQARALEALEAEVTAARAALAASEAALKEYEAQMAARAAAREKARAAARKAPVVDQTKTGTGEWQTAVASHYSRNFTGRGASGASIGPYTMMVAHKTLPFGTLIEFEYNGKRAIASVQDRGPYVKGRTFDLGPGVVRVLGFNGVHEVRYRIISK